MSNYLLDHVDHGRGEVGVELLLVHVALLHGMDWMLNLPDIRPMFLASA